jgi:hypothetical protein
VASIQLGLFTPRPPVASSQAPSKPAFTRLKRAANGSLEPPPVVRREPYVDPFLASIKNQLDVAGDDPVQFKGWDHTKKKTAVGLDVESYSNFFLVMVKRFSDGTYLSFERSRRSEIDWPVLHRILQENVIVTFNGNYYDLPILYRAAQGADPVELKLATNRIIDGDFRAWEIERELGVRVPRLNHIDLMEPNPSLKASLKTLTGRLHGKFVVDLPFPPDKVLTFREMNVTTLYCANDLDSNQLLYEAMREALELRVNLGGRYGQDFRSKSDSQVGEAIVRKRIKELVGNDVDLRPNLSVPPFRYEPPSFLRFDTDAMKRTLELVRSVEFHVKGNGKTSKPAELENLIVPLGEGRYSMGNGGLHSTETHRKVLATDEMGLEDVDIASQYPRIILNLGLYPAALGPTFLTVYRDIVEERLAAKAAGDKATADGVKIAINGVYGKLSSPYSFLYAPPLATTITLTGQLAVLMLIERSELAGIRVVSANTDGVVFHYPRGRRDELDALIAAWEADTGFEIEKTPYQALYSSSVNTYLALKPNGKVKVKGPLADPWDLEPSKRDQMQKNPQMTVCTHALVNLVRDGTPLAETIHGCRDPRAFVTMIKSTVGAKWRGYYLGRAIRYYWSTDGEAIRTAKGNNQVAKTEGAKPLQELPDEVPADVDYDRYCEETADLAAQLAII